MTTVSYQRGQAVTVTVTTGDEDTIHIHLKIGDDYGATLESQKSMPSLQVIAETPGGGRTTFSIHRSHVELVKRVLDEFQQLQPKRRRLYRQCSECGAITDDRSAGKCRVHNPRRAGGE